MLEKVETSLADVEADMANGEASKPRKAKKVAKKAPKKVAKKVAKKSSNGESDSSKVTLADLASEAQITTAAARRKLREAELSREGRWSWEDGSKGLKDARKALGLDD